MRRAATRPPILIENSTAANRAVNIPEFVNVAPAGIEHIDTPAVDFYRQFDIAAALAKKGDYTAAIREWTKALAMGTDDARAHNNFGASLAGAGRMDEAIAQYRQALAAMPDYPEAHNNLGNALAGAGPSGEAIGQYRQALEGDPGSAEAHNNLGTALTNKGVCPKPSGISRPRSRSARITRRRTIISASPWPRQAVSTRPSRTIASHRERSCVHRRPQQSGRCAGPAGQARRGHRAFPQGTRVEPGGAREEANLGRALLAQGKFDEAIPHLERALTRVRKRRSLHNDLGMALAEKSRLDEAIPHFEKAVALEPAMGMHTPTWDAHTPTDNGLTWPSRISKRRWSGIPVRRNCTLNSGLRWPTRIVPRKQPRI